MQDIEEVLKEIGRNEFLEMENHRLIQEIKHMTARLNRYQQKQKQHKRIISKQNQLLQQLGYTNDKQYYVNVQKGRSDKRRRGRGK